MRGYLGLSIDWADKKTALFSGKKPELKIEVHA